MYKGCPSTDIYPSYDIYPSIFRWLVYDRTQEDINHRNELHEKIRSGTATATEIAEWNGSYCRGAYNYTDLNRVGEMLLLIKTMSEPRGFIITYPYTVKTDYTRNNLPTGTDVAQLLENILTVRQTFSKWITTTVPTAIKTINDANAIEYILFQVESIFSGTESEFKYSGDLYAGGN